jgi:hypothetical protein
MATTNLTQFWYRVLEKGEKGRARALRSGHSARRTPFSIERIERFSMCGGSSSHLRGIGIFYGTFSCFRRFLSSFEWKVKPLANPHGACDEAYDFGPGAPRQLCHGTRGGNGTEFLGAGARRWQRVVP